MKKRILALLVCALLAVAVLAGCGGTPAPSDASGSAPEATDGYSTSLQDIKDAGVLIIGLDDTFAPMGFRESDGTLVGFDIDLGEAVCEVLGVEAKFQPVAWDAKEMELATGNIDCIWNGLSMTPERIEQLSMTEPYLNNKIAVMTAEGVTIASKADLADYNIAIQASSAALEAVEADDEYDTFADNITEYETYDEALLALDAGREDCVVIDEVFGNYKNSQVDNKYGFTDFDFGDDLYAVGFRKSDTELTDAVTDAIQQLIESGAAAEISDKWFGKDIVIGA